MKRKTLAGVLVVVALAFGLAACAGLLSRHIPEGTKLDVNVGDQALAWGQRLATAIKTADADQSGAVDTPAEWAALETQLGAAAVQLYLDLLERSTPPPAPQVPQTQPAEAEK